MLKRILIVCLFSVGLMIVHHNAFADAKYSIKIMTPEVKSALDGRRSRYDQLREYKTSGALGENNQGYVAVLKSEGSADSVAAQENQDRKVIYQTIAEQNGLDNAIGTIERVFAQVQRDKADSGDKIELEDGTWSTK